MQPERIVFDRDTYTLLLHVNPESFSLPKYVESRVQEEGLQMKEECHITIFGFGTARNISQALSSDREKIGELAGLIENTDWSFEPTQEFYIVKKPYKINGVVEERETLIVMIRLPKLAEFIGQASRLLNIPLEVPPVHVTLCAKSTLEENMLAGIGISSQEEFKRLSPESIISPRDANVTYQAIALPTRPQPDTIVAIFILKQFGEEKFPGIQNAEYVFLPRIPEGETEESLTSQGILLVDVGGGALDHHSKALQTTASNLIAEYLGIKNNPALSKLLQYAERDDFYGKGTISVDSLDRAFGLSGLIGSLNKKYIKEPAQVVDTILPLLSAFYEEEARRAFEMPQEFKEKLARGKAQIFSIRQKGKILQCVLIDTDNASMAGFLRSKGGGGFDVVALRLSSGHVNILTKPAQKVDLRSLAVLIRIQETEAQGKSLEGDPQALAIPGTIKEVPEWYYDTATNSLLNGGPNPQNVKPTSIDSMEMAKILEVGLSEQLWAPSR
jgi:hypothetical protein